jgi:hypothetical protein
VQHIPATLVQQMPGVPASLLGLSGGSLVANRYYQADVTYWVDPRTGVLIDQQEKGVSYLHGPTGQGYLTVADFNLRMTDASSRALAAQMTLIRLTAPGGRRGARPDPDPPGRDPGRPVPHAARPSPHPPGAPVTSSARRAGHLIRPARRSPHPLAAPGET